MKSDQYEYEECPIFTVHSTMSIIYINVISQLFIYNSIFYEIKSLLKLMYNVSRLIALILYSTSHVISHKCMFVYKYQSCLVNRCLSRWVVILFKLLLSRVVHIYLIKLFLTRRVTTSVTLRWICTCFAKVNLFYYYYR